MNWPALIIGAGAGALVYYLGTSDSIQVTLQESWGMQPEDAHLLVIATAVGAAAGGFYAGTRLFDGVSPSFVGSGSGTTVSEAATAVSGAPSGSEFLGTPINSFISSSSVPGAAISS